MIKDLLATQLYSQARIGELGKWENVSALALCSTLFEAHRET
jgi:hypothetical protein